MTGVTPVPSGFSTKVTFCTGRRTGTGFGKHGGAGAGKWRDLKAIPRGTGGGERDKSRRITGPALVGGWGWWWC